MSSRIFAAGASAVVLAGPAIVARDDVPLAKPAAVRADEPGPLVGKRVPALELSHSLQGMPWSPEDFAGEVVLLDFFQVGCPGCWFYELPQAQLLLDQHASDERFRVVAVATAFEKAATPEIAQDSVIRSELAANKYTMAVMRDRDEKSVRLVGTKEGFGTPMTLVVGPDGLVRFHGFCDHVETVKTVRELVKQLLHEYDAPPIEPLPPALGAYAKHDYGAASAAALSITQNSTSPHELRLAAERVQKNLSDVIAARLAWIDRKRARGLTVDAQRMLERALETYVKVPAAKSFVDRRNEWKNDPKFAKELAAATELDKILAEVANPDASRDKLVASLQKLAKSCEKTPVAERIARELERLK